MNRIDRLTAILLQLQTKQILRGKEIARRFGISLCTVYRDIRSLEDAGVPIGTEPGLGYFLTASYDHMSHWLLSYVDSAEVISPEVLKRSMSDHATRLFAHYHPTSN